MNSLDSIHEAVSNYQQAETLEACITVLERWHDLEPLAEPLRAKQRELEHRGELLTHEIQRTYKTHGTL